MKVSIIIPSVDGEREGLTAQSIDSCQYQDGFTLGVDYEVILQKGDFLLGKNINDAVLKAKGKYIKILADDDLLTPNCLKDLYEKAEEGFDFVCADAIDFSGYSEKIHRSRLPLRVMDLQPTNPIHGGTVMYRKETMPLWNETMWTAEEYEIMLRMADLGLRFVYIPIVVYRYRLHDQQKWQNYCAKDPITEQYRYEYIESLQAQYANNYKLINNGH